MLSSGIAVTRSRVIRQVPPALIYTISGAATYYLLCVLPYAFPAAAYPRILSASYVFGFNNKVAILGLIAVIAVLTFFQVKSRFGFIDDLPEQVAVRRLDGPLVKLFAVASLWYLALTVTIYFVVAKTNGFYRFDWESSHFIWHTRMMYLYGSRPYLDFVTSYGPALAYLPAWSYSALKPFGISIEASYYVLHYVLNLVGLAALTMLVNSFAIAPSYKRIAFSSVALSGFSLPMGLSGLLIRYLLPYVGLLCVHAANAYEVTRKSSGA